MCLSSCCHLLFLFFELVGAGGFGVFNGERNHVIWEAIIKEQDDKRRKAHA